MSKYLVIVESPGKVKSIQGYLGSDFKVVASVGHVREIPKKGLGIDVKNGFEPHYEISSDKRDVVAKIREEAKKAEKIYLASDADREGEGIAEAIFELLPKTDQKKCCRITYIEITKKALLEAIKKPRDIDKDLADAQKARQVLDRLIGYKVSPLLWSNVADKTSAGRCQSIALKIVCERENEIKAFKSEDFWYIDASLNAEKGDFIARVTTEDKDNRFTKEDEAEKANKELENANYKVGNIERKEKESRPNPPFDTAGMQQACSSVFGWPLKKTNLIAQKLYENAKITYLRTDSFNISEEALTSVRVLIGEKYNKEYLPKTVNVYKEKKDKVEAQGAHECIRPTHVEDEGEDLVGDDEKLYNLIRDRFIACQMSNAVVNTVVYNIKTDTKYNLIAKGQSVKFDGWTKAYKYVSSKEEVLPHVEKDEKLKLLELNKTKGQTQPPARYNSATLMNKMKGEGVGRPSTYATITESIQTRGYAEEIKGKKGALQATDLGMKVYEYLQKNFPDFIMNIGFTALLEDDLDIIETGKKKFVDVVGKTYDTMQGFIRTATGTSGDGKDGDSTHQCTVCKSGNIIGKNGKFGKFYACSCYPECKTIFEMKDGKFVVKEKKEYTGKSDAKDTGATCTVCKKGKIMERKGQYGVFYGCNAYPKCKTIYVKDDDGNFKRK